MSAHVLKNPAVLAGTLAVLAALFALFATLLDQGQLLTPVLGKAAQTANYLHEFTHDGRHLLGAPCH
ncbi:CbtB-domain containing protein [Carbonactinospora thermoautotrophica]|nr:CbtB-domain containing protein [Carbonactinospora thermoautotrophica]